ncbi:MAG: hypothetical protein K0Q48_440 [Bacillota bacterium]|jgi:hypothetical protein|nr:hypothetical protein [Bacillota bacterium]
MSKRTLRSRFSAIFLSIALIFFISGADCFAAQVDTALTVNVRIYDREFNIANYTLDEIKQMPQLQFAYSSVTPADAPSIIAAQGVSLEALLTDLGIEPAEVSELRFVSSDGGVLKFDEAELLGAPRYYYPEIFQVLSSGAQAAGQSVTTQGGTVQNNKTQSDIVQGEADYGRREAVPVILALGKREYRSGEQIVFSELNTGEGISLCFGQRDISDKVSLQYGRYIHKITLRLKNEEGFQIPDKPYGSGEELREPFDRGGSLVQTPQEEEDIDRGLTADTLTFSAGYFGGPYEIRKVFTLDELYAMKLKDQAYTYIDNMPAVVLESARGILLTELLEAAGIDVNSVESFHFYCSDVKSSWYQTIAKDYLIDTLRYYYPKLPTSWDYDEASALDGASDQQVQVETIIALEDNWKRFAVVPDFDHTAKKSRFRLVFGQTDTETKNAYRSARWIHTIEVMLGGKPPEGQNEPVAVVGSKVRHDDTVGLAGKEVDAGVQNWRVYEMSETAAELAEPERENPLLPWMAAAAVLFFTAGLSYELLRFWKEVK